MNEHQRHVKARESILRGETPEKRIFVHMEDLEEKKKREDEIKADRELKNDRMDALKGAKTPWFCPECNKVMKSRLDDKMRSAERLEVFKDFRMPWFCPECDKVMKQRLDDKMWRLYGHCFDCQIQVENKMRINGTFNGYAKKKVLENKKSWIKEQIQGIEEWKNQDDVVFYNQINPEI